MSGRTQSEESSSCCDRVSKTWSKVNERSFPSTSCGWFFTLKRQTLSCGSSGSSGRTRTATRTEVSSRGEEEITSPERALSIVAISVGSLRIAPRLAVQPGG